MANDRDLKESLAEQVRKEEEEERVAMVLNVTLGQLEAWAMKDHLGYMDTVV